MNGNLYITTKHFELEVQAKNRSKGNSRIKKFYPEKSIHVPAIFIKFITLWKVFKRKI